MKSSLPFDFTVDKETKTVIVIREFAAMLRSYNCLTVHGDKYGGEFPREQFQKRGVRYEISAKTKSEL